MWYLMENVQETYILHTISLSQFLDVLPREMTYGIWWRMYKKPIYYIPSLSLSLNF